MRINLEKLTLPDGISYINLDPIEYYFRMPDGKVLVDHPMKRCPPEKAMDFRPKRVAIPATNEEVLEKQGCVEPGAIYYKWDIQVSQDLCRAVAAKQKDPKVNYILTDQETIYLFKEKKLATNKLVVPMYSDPINRVIFHEKFLTNSWLVTSDVHRFPRSYNMSGLGT